MNTRTINQLPSRLFSRESNFQVPVQALGISSQTDRISINDILTSGITHNDTINKNADPQFQHISTHNLNRLLGIFNLTSGSAPIVVNNNIVPGFFVNITQGGVSFAMNNQLHRALTMGIDAVSIDDPTGASSISLGATHMDIGIDGSRLIQARSGGAPETHFYLLNTITGNITYNSSANFTNIHNGLTYQGGLFLSQSASALRSPSTHVTEVSAIDNGTLAITAEGIGVARFNRTRIVFSLPNPHGVVHNYFDLDGTNGLIRLGNLQGSLMHIDGNTTTIAANSIRFGQTPGTASISILPNQMNIQANTSLNIEGLTTGFIRFAGQALTDNLGMINDVLVRNANSHVKAVNKASFLNWLLNGGEEHVEILNNVTTANVGCGIAILTLGKSSGVVDIARGVASTTISENAHNIEIGRNSTNTSILSSTVEVGRGSSTVRLNSTQTTNPALIDSVYVRGADGSLLAISKATLQAWLAS